MISPTMDARLERRLRDGAAMVGAAIDDRLVAAIGRYLDLLVFWNRKVNLTSIREPPEIIDRHFVDSLSLLPFSPGTARSLADLGSGGGFPGAVLALARPDLAVDLVESIHKKAAFLETLRRELPLPNVRVHTLRAETWAANLTTPPDVLVSRAVWDLPEWLSRAAVINADALILGMEGADLHPLPPGATRHSIPHPSGRRSVITYVPRGT
jgi:16S rRNA (guanine527-N7)-methyltransferase